MPYSLLCISLSFCLVLIFKVIHFTTLLVSGILRYPCLGLFNSQVKVHSCQASAATKASIVVWELHSWGSHVINITGPMGDFKLVVCLCTRECRLLKDMVNTHSMKQIVAIKKLNRSWRTLPLSPLDAVETTVLKPQYYITAIITKQHKLKLCR